MTKPATLVWIALGGAVGAVCRYQVTEFVLKRCGPNFPWGTVAVNMIGSFLIGILWVCAIRGSLSEAQRMLLIVGLLGAFTTFSTFSLDTLNLLQAGNFKAAVGYTAGSLVGGIALAGLGVFVAHRIAEHLAPAS